LASHLHQVDVKVKGDFGDGHLSKSLMQLRDQTATENGNETATEAVFWPANYFELFNFMSQFKVSEAIRKSRCEFHPSSLIAFSFFLPLSATLMRVQLGGDDIVGALRIGHWGSRNANECM